MRSGSGACCLRAFGFRFQAFRFHQGRSKTHADAAGAWHAGGGERAIPRAAALRTGKRCNIYKDYTCVIPPLQEAS
ncbi:hypothetical protein GCM10023144_10700 [Pigmentiphaga soli]|uniref:Uncharacterized protein n=1 Tax=Pigmentiphaga soli TaxID=1007095 RepID=A0ABP8GLY4_9BURK